MWMLWNYLLVLVHLPLTSPPTTAVALACNKFMIQLLPFCWFLWTRCQFWFLFGLPPYFRIGGLAVLPLLELLTGRIPLRSSLQNYVPFLFSELKTKLFITCFFILFVGYSYLLKRAADRRKNLSPLPLQEQWNYLLPLLALSMGIPAIKVWRFSPNRSEPFCPSRKDSCAGSLGLGNLSFMLPLFMNPRM